MKIGDKYEDGGRVLIVDEVLDNGKYLTHVLGKVGEVEEETKEPIKEDSKEPTVEEPPTEEVKTIEGELIEEVEPVVMVTEPAEAAEEVFKCQYCGRVIKSKVGLASHEKACKENPVNK